MVDFSYSTVSGKLKDLLGKIREVGVPLKATNKWLESLGYKSTNDRTMLPVLKQIGFLDSSGVPTDLWKQYRGSKHKIVLARGIRDGYGALFQMYADAFAKPNSDLEHFFKTRSSAGAKAIQFTVATFKALCQQADFQAIGLAGPSADEERAAHGNETESLRVLTKGAVRNTGLTINVNVQLTLPESKDPKVYERLFAALEKHLLKSTDGED